MKKNFRWTIIAIAFIAIIITYLDRMAIAYSIIPLKKAFHLSNSKFGFIASAFGFGYAVMTIIGGILIDRYGARKIWMLSAITWSLACISFGLATGVWMLFVFRLFLGVAEGPTFPALTRTVTDWLPISERARALGAALAAVPLSSAIGAPLISYLLIWFDWRISFFILGVMGIVWGIVWYIIFRDLPQECKYVSSRELSLIESNQELNFIKRKHRTAKTTWRFMLFNPSLLVNNYAFFVFGYLLFFALVWLPGFFEQTYGINLKKTGWFLIIPWLTATVLLILGGILSDWLWQRYKRIRIARSHLIWVCQLLSGFCFIPLLYDHSLPTSILCISLGLGLGMMPNAAFYAINADLAKDRAATSLGIMDSASAIAGILAPLLTGFFSTLTGNFKFAFLILIVFTMSSAAAIFLFQRPD